MASAKEVADALFCGVTLNGEYRVTAYRGLGGFCFVLEAIHVPTSSQVALKVLRPDRSASGLEELKNEGRLLDRLRRASHVVDLFGEHENHASIPLTGPGSPTPIPMEVSYLVLELAAGCLVDLLPRRDEIPWPERLAFFRDVVRGVHQMHLEGIVHRDLKTENVLLFDRGDVPSAEVADLGRSRALDAAPAALLDEYLTGRGDLRFAPPELAWCTGLSDHSPGFRAADLYLLGSLLFELTTGQGVTAIALGDPRRVMADAMRLGSEERQQVFQSRLGDIRASFEPAYALFGGEVPDHLRFDAVELLRQLCDPDPTKRGTRRRAERNLSPWSLEWILRRVDILLLRDHQHRKQLAARRRRRPVHDTPC